MDFLSITEGLFDTIINPTVATFILGYVFGASSWAWKQEMIDNIVRLGKYIKTTISQKKEENKDE